MESINKLRIPNSFKVIELNQKFSDQAHINLKGFTQTKHDHKSHPSYMIYMLCGLPRIEFEAVLAHELLHVWLHENEINLSFYVRLLIFY